MKHITDILNIKEINEATASTTEVYLIVGVNSNSNTVLAEHCTILKYNASKTALKLLQDRYDANGNWQQSDGKTWTATKNKIFTQIEEAAKKHFPRLDGKLRKPYIYGFCLPNEIKSI